MRVGHWPYWLAGLVLLIAVNSIVLVGVYLNRQPPAESVIELSERELDVSFGGYGHEVSETVSLRLNYRWPSQGGEEVYIAAAKMPELGFAINPEPVNCTEGRMPKRSSRDGFLVLEINGPAYQEELEAARKAYTLAVQRSRARPGDKARKSGLEVAENKYDYERYRASRMLVVDAGLDREALRARYPDSAQYVLVSASLQPGTRRLEVSDDLAQLCTFYATASLAMGGIHVPREYRDVFVREASLRQYGRYGQGIDVKPFMAKLAFGKRLEPWLLSVQPTQP